MAYTFGGATTDSILWTGQSNIGNAGIGLVAGWWRPTTLTATRRLWSAGATTGVAIDTTTSELRLTNDSFSGTDGVFTTTGAGLATNTWTFVAAMVSVSNSPGSQWKVWVGSATTPPAEVTISTVSSITTNTNGPTGNTTIGNTNGGSVAFQGVIDNVLVVNDSATASVVTNPFQSAAYGTITATEAQWTLERWIRPHWAGRLPNPDLLLTGASSFAYHWNGSGAVRWHRNAGQPQTAPFAPTISGATVSADRCPRPCTQVVGNFPTVL